MKKRFFLALLGIFVFIQFFHPPISEAKKYPGTEAEFYQYIKDIGIREYDKSLSKRANWVTYRDYNVIAYGYQHGRVKMDSKCKNDAEYEYIGYDYYDSDITNDCFPDDEVGSSPPEKWNYQVVDSDLSSWRILSFQRDHIMNSNLQGHGATSLTVAKLGGQKYAKVESPPTWKSEGNIYTENKGKNGKIYYATFQVPPIANGALLEGLFQTDKDTYTIESDAESVNVNYTVRAKAVGSGKYFSFDQIKQLKAGFNPNGTTSLKASDYTITSGTQYALKSSSFSLSRAKYAPGTYKITLEGMTYIESVMGDKDSVRPTKTITLIVKPSADQFSTTTLSVSPKSIQFSEQDVKVKASVTGKVQGVSASSIKQWMFSIREAEVTQTTTKLKSEQALSSTATFDLVIPKSKISSGFVTTDKVKQYIQKYVARARPQLSNGVIVDSNSASDSVTIYEDAAPPPTPEKGGPIADFTWTPTDDLKVGDSVRLDEACTHPDNLSIVGWQWSKTGSIFASGKNTSTTLDNFGANLVTLSCTDVNGKSNTITKNIDVEKINYPPIAQFLVNNQYYWIETVSPQDESMDPDGTIVNREFRVDGKLTNMPTNFPRVTEPELHTISLEVTDDGGLSDSTSKQVSILPTIPTADFAAYGFNSLNMKLNNIGKVNRLIEVDPTLSDSKSPVSVAPIDYSKTTYDIKPLTDGVEQSDILIRNDSDKSKLQFLTRKPGEYEITITVTNKLGETSKPVTKKITVEEDKKPLSAFSVDKKVEYRDDTGKARIRLVDQSLSPDDDPIKERIWFVEYDSNNDGLFGTPEDEPKQVISDGNEKELYFETNKVGNYRFSLKVIEGYGQPTLPEFINSEDFLSDSSEVTDPMGRVDEYLKDGNFNIPSKDKAVKVDNSPPVVDFGMVRHNNVDIVLDFGGLTTATQQHERTSYGNNARYYRGAYQETREHYIDNYTYTFDNSETSKMSAIAADLEEQLRTKGINCRVSIENAYYHNEDTDGKCEKNIPNWGYTNWTTTSYQYDTVTTTSPSYSPPSGWYITSSSSDPVYTSKTERLEKSCTQSNYVTNCEAPAANPSWEWADGWVDPDTEVIHELYTRTVQVYQYTNYTYHIEKANTEYHSLYEIQSYSTVGCNSSEATDTTDFRQQFNNKTYNTDSDKFYIRFDKTNWDWSPNEIATKMKKDNIFFWNVAVGSNKNDAEQAILSGSKLGKFEVYDPSAKEKHIQDITDFFINKYMLVEDSEQKVIVVGDRLDYKVDYSDQEKDPQLKLEWKFTHDNTKLGDLVMDNQPTNPIPQSDQWISAPLQLTEPGTYKVQLRAMDDPVWFKDSRFYNFRKWSDESLVREYTIIVHRKPIADFSFNVDKPNNNRLTLDPSLSYDPDFQHNRSDNGIVEYTWSYYLDGKKYEGMPPAYLENEKNYDVTLQVKDLHGAVASITKRISTGMGNHKPVAKFDVQNTVSLSTKLNFQDYSYDPDGDPLTNYQITIREQGKSQILKTLSTFPISFKDMMLPAGDYVIGLTVNDVPKIGPSLQSDLFEKNIKVLNDNRPPVSQFSLTPNPVFKGNLLTYKDSSYDPDNDPLINYSWKVDLLDDSGNVAQTWNTGVPPTDLLDFGGIGKYRITQTVYDSPPYPLPSLSGSSSVEVEMILGPQNPYAAFTWHPNDRKIVAGEKFVLDPVNSYDLDGDVVSYDWKITDPNGKVTTSTNMFPSVDNAIEGIYKVQLYVTDNDGLRSKVPAEHDIQVYPLPPNSPPIAKFYWDPFKPFLGENITLNPDSSYDLDGEIVSYNWTIKSKEGSVQTSTQKYPVFIGDSAYYDVTLTVTDDRGGTGTVTQKIDVNIAKLTPLVTHSEEWQAYWIKQGEDKDTNKFLAGEHFSIVLKTTPAKSVWGEVKFGGEVGTVDIPSSSFTLVNKTQYEYTWKADLYQANFIKIPNGTYYFNFHAMHPDVTSPFVQSDAVYPIEIVGNVYESYNFHRTK